MMGKVAELHCALGARVKAGDLIARLSVQELSARLDQARETLAQAALELARTTKLRASGAATKQANQGDMAMPGLVHLPFEREDVMVMLVEAAGDARVKRWPSPCWCMTDGPQHDRTPKVSTGRSSRTSRGRCVPARVSHRVRVGRRCHGMRRVRLGTPSAIVNRQTAVGAPGRSPTSSAIASSSISTSGWNASSR